MSIAVNTLIEMNREINELPRPRTFLRNRFFGGRERGIPQYNVAYDAIQGVKKLAPFVNATNPFKHIARAEFDTRIFKFPLIAPLDILTEPDVASRIAGELIGGGMSAEERQTQDRTRRMAFLDDMITRREEAMIGQMLVLGVISIVGEGVNDTIDLSTIGWNGVSDITDATQDWDAATPNPTILHDLRTWKNDIYSACGIIPDTVVMGEDAAEEFMTDTAVLAMLDKWRVNVGEIQYQDQDGAEFLGRILGMDIFCDSDGYVSDADAATKFINAQYVVVGCSAARVPEAEILYGPYHDVATNTTFLQSRNIVPDDADSIENILRTKMVSRPLPYNPYVKSWRSYRVID